MPKKERQEDKPAFAGETYWNEFIQKLIIARTALEKFQGAMAGVSTSNLPPEATILARLVFQGHYSEVMRDVIETSAMSGGLESMIIRRQEDVSGE